MILDYIGAHKKIIFLTIVGLLVLYAYTTFGLAITTIVSTPSSKEATVSFSNPDGEVTTSFKTLPGKKKITLVKRSSSQFKAESDGAYKGRLVSFGLLWLKNISISVEPQKRSEAIGSSVGSCVVDNQKGSYIMYYRCDMNSDLVTFTSDGKSYTSSIPTGSLESTNAVIKPYMNGYMKFVLADRQLIIESFQFSDGKMISSGVASSGFSGELDEAIVTTDVGDMNSKKFALLNKDSGEVIMYDSLGATPKTVNISEKLKKYKDSVFALKLNSDRLVLFSGQALYEGEGEQISKSDSPQSLFFIDFASGELDKEKNIEKSLRVTDFSLNSEGNVLFYAKSDKPSEVGIYTATPTHLNKIDLPDKISSVGCWKDSKHFYYILENNDVLIYSIKDGIYKLAYSAKSGIVVNIDCYSGDLYVAYSPNGSSVTDPRYSFLKVSESDLTGTPVESVLPIGPGAAYEIDRAYSFRDKIFVNLINMDYYDPNVRSEDIPKLRPKNPEKIQNGALEYFKSQGVDINSYSFEFSY